MIKKNCMMIKKSINVFGFSTKFGFNKKINESELKIFCSFINVSLMELS